MKNVVILFCIGRYVQRQELGFSALLGPRLAVSLQTLKFNRAGITLGARTFPIFSSYACHRKVTLI